MKDRKRLIHGVFILVVVAFAVGLFAEKKSQVLKDKNQVVQPALAKQEVILSNAQQQNSVGAVNTEITTGSSKKLSKVTSSSRKLGSAQGVVDLAEIDMKMKQFSQGLGLRIKLARNPQQLDRFRLQLDREIAMESNQRIRHLLMKQKQMLINKQRKMVDRNRQENVKNYLRAERSSYSISDNKEKNRNALAQLNKKISETPEPQLRGLMLADRAKLNSAMNE